MGSPHAVKSGLSAKMVGKAAMICATTVSLTGSEKRRFVTNAPETVRAGQALPA